MALGGFQKWISLTDRQIRAKLIYDLLVIMLHKSLMPISISNEKKKLFYLPSTYYIPWNKYSLSIYNAMVTQWSILTKKQQLLLKPNTNTYTKHLEFLKSLISLELKLSSFSFKICRPVLYAWRMVCSICILLLAR